MRFFRKAVANDANGISALYEELATLSPVEVVEERITEISNDLYTYLICIPI